MTEELCKYKMFYKHFFPVVYNPFIWYLIWHKLLFQASLSHHKFGCLPCFLGFKFPKCSLLKSSVHSKVYALNSSKLRTGARKPHSLIVLILAIRITTRRSHLIRLFTLSGDATTAGNFEDIFVCNLHIRE